MATGRLSPSQAILRGTFIVGTIDAIDALVFFGLRGSTPIRIFQSIASGALGRAAYRDGLPAAALGVLIHYFVAFGIVTMTIDQLYFNDPDGTRVQLSANGYQG